MYFLSFGTSWGISWHDNSINYLDFLKAVENSKPTRPQPEEKEESTPINFATLNPEDILKSIQEVVASSGPALSMVRQAAKRFDCGN